MFLIALAAFVGATAALPARAETVGKLTAVQTDISRSGKSLAAGSGIVLGDTLVSDATGLGMIVFNDQSSARVGPNSQLTIDEFVYSGGSGSATVRMDRGVSRFFGGRISKKGSLSVRTPHVVLAVRGGIIDVESNASGTSATLRAGKLVCRTASGAQVIITKPGFSCLADGRKLTSLRVPAAVAPQQKSNGNGSQAAEKAAKPGAAKNANAAKAAQTTAAKMPKSVNKPIKSQDSNAALAATAKSLPKTGAACSGPGSAGAAGCATRAARLPNGAPARANRVETEEGPLDIARSVRGRLPNRNTLPVAPGTCNVPAGKPKPAVAHTNTLPCP